MAASHENVSMALFCDFENVALGVRDANYEKLDIRLVLEKLLLKGSIVIKKAYCDWDRYKGFKAAMHEANFELIEIPHVRQSGKNSADIRLVVDALDLCYTKSHLDTFVIISGDSDFSPLVSKLRENAKYVIGVGVKQSTSDLLIANCDEFIFYDDLVRETQRSAARRDARENGGNRRSPEDERRRKEEMDARRSKAIELAVETFDALVAERGDSGKIWASALKDAIKRRKPDFNESYYGFRAFGNLLEEARARGLLDIGRDEKSGTFVYRSAGAAETAGGGESDAQGGRQEARQEGRQDGRRKGRDRGQGNGRRDEARGDQGDRGGQGDRGDRNERDADHPFFEEAGAWEEARDDAMHDQRGEHERDAASPFAEEPGAGREERREGRRSSRGRGRADRDSRPRSADGMMPQPPSVDTEIAEGDAASLPTGAPADTGLMDDPTPAAPETGAKPARKRHPVPARTAKAAAKKATQEATRQAATPDLFAPAPARADAGANETTGQDTSAHESASHAAADAGLQTPTADTGAAAIPAKTGAGRRGAGRRAPAKKSAGAGAEAAATAASGAAAPTPTQEPIPKPTPAASDSTADAPPAAKRAPRKTASRTRRPRKDDTPQ